MRRLFCAIFVLVLLTSNLCLCAAEEAERPVHNYMLIIDNSRSTTGQHSLGAATDPKGLRFDAARLVYENVLSSAEAGGKGKIGVIVFCGTDNCVCYGPMDIDADPDDLDAVIGSQLNEAANQDRRDNYTDIRTALESAREMIRDFTGTTSVILLTDGVNDLTNLSDPFSQPENIEANDQSVEIVGELQGLGADFYVIALTAQGSVSNADDFIAFINRMAQAGGGRLLDNGMYSNVLMATQADLNSKLLQTLIRAENATENSIDDQVLYTPVTWPFSVPYSGISDATVNITFMPQDKARLKTIDLITPEGKTYSVYAEGAAQPGSDISITDDRSYIILSIPSPAPGEWQLKLDGQKDAEIPINVVVRFNHQLRVRMDAPESVPLGEKVPVRVWLQRYNGERYEDLDDDSIYALSNATLTLLSPTKGSTAKAVELRREGNRFATSVKLKTPGTWTLGASIENEYLVERLEGVAIEVLPAPTASPRAASESGNEEDFSWKAEADPDSWTMTVAWEGAGTENARAELRKTGSDKAVISDIKCGDKIDIGKLEPEQEYQILLVAYSSDEEGGVPPPMEPLDIQLIPDPETVGNVILTIADAMIKLEPYMEFSGDMAQSDMSAPEFAGEGDAGSGVASEGSSSGSAGLTRSSSGGDGGDVDGSSRASSGSETGKDSSITKGDSEAEATAPADNARASGDADPGDAAPSASQEEAATQEAAPEADATGVQGIINKVRDNWTIAAGGVGLLAVIIIIVVIARNAFGEKVTGNLKIVCEKIGLEMLLSFDGHNSIKSNSPITKHPDIAKLKGGKFYDVLSNLQVSATQADEYGMVSGSEVHHMPNDRLITVTYTDPRNGNQQTCHVGRLDSEEAVLNVYDAGRTYELHLNGNLSFEELSRLTGKR